MLDWKPETRSLYRRLKKAGFEPVTVSDRVDAPEKIKSEEQAIDVLTCCDESQLNVTKNNESFGLFLVYGNSPGELVCDHTYRETPTGKLLEDTVTEHYNAWEGRTQPTT